MVNKTLYDTKIYTDINSVKGLHQLNKKDSAAATKEVAQQFEAMMMQMVLKSMRDANKSFSSGTFDSNAMDIFQDMFDKQLGLVMSNQSLGIADFVEKSIKQRQQGSNTTIPDKSVNQIRRSHTISNDTANRMALTATSTPPATKSTEPGFFASAEQFVKHIWKSAQQAAKFLAVDPKILVAQAALETNWGQKIINANGNSSFNLFNIKDNTNQGMQAATLEERNGILVKETANFRNYASFKDSFMDFVNLVKNNQRYQSALNSANPNQFIERLQAAGYATDTNYAKKVLQIFHSDKLQAIVNSMENNNEY